MHADNLLFILLGLAFVVLRWLAQRATNSNKQPRQDPEPPTRSPAESEEDRMRRFMEALGNPVGSKPPPKVTPHRVEPTPPVSAERQRAAPEREMKAPKKSIWTGPLPPLTTAPPPQPERRRATLPESTKRASAPQKAAQKTLRSFEAAPRFEVVEQSAASPPALPVPSAASLSPAVRERPAAATTADIQALLSSADGLRSAVLLREILGAPRAFEPLKAF